MDSNERYDIQVDRLNCRARTLYNPLLGQSERLYKEPNSMTCMIRLTWTQLGNHMHTPRLQSMEKSGFDVKPPRNCQPSFSKAEKRVDYTSLRNLRMDKRCVNAARGTTMAHHIGIQPSAIERGFLRYPLF